jgi:hypothetical protein
VAQVNIKLAQGECVLLDDKSTNKSKSNKQWSLTAEELHEAWKISSEINERLVLVKRRDDNSIKLPANHGGERVLLLMFILFFIETIFMVQALPATHISTKTKGDTDC